MPDFRAAETARLYPERTEMHPPGMVDPLFLHEIAEARGQTVTELLHGRGTPISIHELTVELPAFYAYKAREAERQQKEAEKEAEKTRGRVG